MGIMKKAREMGIKVPEDLKVVGYDNLIYARSSDQSITTVNVNAQLVGQQAGKYVMNETKELQCIKINSSSIFKHSCGCQVMDENLEYSSTQILNQVVENERFTAQMELMQQIFTEATDVFTLLTKLDLCF